MNDSILISMKAASDMVPCLEGRINWFDKEIESLTQQRETAMATLAEIKAKLVQVNPEELSIKRRIRLPKGQGEKLIVQVLSELKGEPGLLMTELEKRTGVNHPVAYRALKKLETSGQVIRSNDGLWKMK